MVKHYNRLWVHNDFKRIIKIKSAEEELDLISYTKKLADQMQESLEIKKNEKKNKWFKM